MKRIITLFGIAVMAAFAFTAISTALASAETTKLLPEATEALPIKDTATQTGEGHLLSINGLEVKCKTAAGSETWTSANLGTFAVTFKECKAALLTTCTGEGQAEGSVVVKGLVHFWLALEMLTSGSKLIGALVYLIKPAVNFTCVNKTKTIKNEIVVQESCIAAKDLDLNSLISTEDEEFTEWTSGETLILSVLPESSTKEIPCLPTLKLNGGAAELFAIDADFVVNGYTRNGESITVELMNPEG